ncbi:MAG TPA: PDZ domain-containing protein, partial [Methylomirabilota bacterium]|nr:PDZ domain-containing protein [Methylomirabilota bacterium]
IGEAPDEREAQQRGNGGGSRGGVLGLDVEPITPAIAAQLNLRSTEGVIVRRVEDGSTAADAGIQRGDVVREINRQRVRSQADWDRLTKDVKEGDRITMLLQRGQFSQYVAFTVGRG